MNIKPSIEEVKASAVMFQYGKEEGNEKSITDERISILIDEVYLQIKSWLKENNADVDYSYNAKRLIVLEVIVNLAISYYAPYNSENDYIGELKKERDYYRDLLKENIRKFTGVLSKSKTPKLKEGGVFN